MSYNKDIENSKKIRKMSHVEISKALKNKKEAFYKKSQKIVDRYNKKIDDYYKNKRKKR